MNFLRLKQQDWLLTATICVLLFLGIAVIYSATLGAESELEGAGTVNRQLVFTILGFFIYFIVSNIDPALYKFTLVKIVLLFIITALLVYVLVFGDPVRNTDRWIEWGFIRIQPSEYTKVVLILLNSSILASLLKRREKGDVAWAQLSQKKGIKDILTNQFANIRSLYPALSGYFLAIAISALCIGLILIEPSLGNATITTLLCLSLFLVAFPDQLTLWGGIIIVLISVNMIAGFFDFTSLYNQIGFSFVFNDIDALLVLISIIIIVLIVVKFRLPILFVLVSMIIGILSVFSISYIWENVLEDYQKGRIEIFFNPEEDPQGAGWQLRQSKIAIGSGRLLGKGFLEGSQSKLRYLPESYSDFAFASFSEEFGLVGASFLYALYIFLILRIVRIARRATTTYEGLICFGVAVMILIHVFVNIGMNMGLLPITGIPLPLISYGGSSVMVTMIALGLVQAVKIHRDNIDTQESLVITSKSPWRID